MGSYEIEAVLAMGATSTTFRARHVSLARAVVLRVFHPHAFAAEPGARERARAEAVQTARLEHPGIAAVFDAGAFGEGMFVASALIEGQTLAESVNTGHLLPERSAAIVTCVADALMTAHRAGVVHGEVRPEAITIGRWENPVVRDFGVMRWSGRTGHATREQIAEMLQYAAPEIVLGHPATAATDLYGLAATAVFCLTGGPPSAGLSPAQLLVQRTSAPPPRLLPVAGELSMMLADAMATDPAERPTDMLNFAARLGAAVARLPQTLRDAPSPFELEGDDVIRSAIVPAASSPAAQRPADATRVDRARDLAPPVPATELSLVRAFARKLRRTGRRNVSRP